MIELTKKTVAIMMSLAIIIALTPSLFINGVAFAAETNTVSTTEEAQNALDDAAEGDTIILDEGTYGTLYLRNDNSNANRILQDVTIKAATGKAVHVEQIAYQKITGKSLDIENLVIDGLDFNVPEKSGVLFDADGGGSVRVNGLTVQNCTKIGNKSNGTTYDNAAFIGLYYDGTTAIGTKFAGDNTKTCGYHDIKILNNKIEAVLQPIKCPNAGPLYGMTVCGNTFTDCLDNHMMLSTKTTGTVTVSDNTFDKMTGRAMRIAGAEADAKFVFRNNTVTNPQMYDTGGDGDLTKITGTAGFQVITDTNNDWVKTVDTPTKWIAMGIVAKIGDTSYGTLEDAVDAAKAGDTIELFTNADLTKYAADSCYGSTGCFLDLSDITLDLKGYTITSNNFGVVYEGKDFTIKNGKFVAANGGSYSLFVGDSFTENVVIDDVECTGGINVYNSKNVVIKNTTCTKATGTKYYAVWADEGAEVVIEGGEYASTSTLGGALLGACTKADESTLIIKGGMFRTVGEVNMFVADSNAILMGGTYDVKPSSSLVMKGYKIVDNQNGTWSVVKDTEDSGDIEVKDTSKTMKIKTDISISDINLSPEEIERVYEGEKITVLLDVEKVQDPTKTLDADKVKTLIKEKNLKLGALLDINLFKKFGSEESTQITQTVAPVAITIQIPKNLRTAGRVYSIIRVHDNVAEVIYTGTTDDNWNLTFETDKFSTYAIAYKDTIVSTGDNSNVIKYVVLGVVAILGLVLVLIARKKSLN